MTSLTTKLTDFRLIHTESVLAFARGVGIFQLEVELQKEC